MKFFQRLYCRLFGHSPVQVPAFVFRSRYGLHEIGTLQCKRCGAMTGRYNRNMAEPLSRGCTEAAGKLPKRKETVK